ncbi:MAG: GNAT family N-acetyltransferase [Planctomycetaceae bacterium]|nr:GNAT family N-acetyltransferase [Planctomycetales bacterium]MCB9921450.1 GNAT family N-acetyltransferase [Planctomycetaceae bacterium]
MIQDYNGQYAAVADIFCQAIHRTASEHYTPEQINAWAPLPVDYQRWRVRLEQKRPFLYFDGENICGFIELESDGHIDCHYVHPDYNRMGIGSALLRHVLQIAAGRELPKLFVEASHVAKGLYLKHGFDVIRSNNVLVRGVSMQNWVMEWLS